MDDRCRRAGGDLHGRVEVGGGGSADDEGDVQRAAFGLLDHVDHFVERRGDQAAQADRVGAPCGRFVDDALRLDHDAQVADLVAVAGHDHRDDVFADVVDVALDRGHDHLARRLSAGGILFDIGGEHPDGAFHHARRLDDLRQEHLALAEEFAHARHRTHQQPVDHLHRVAQFAVGFERVGLDVVGHSSEQSVFDAFRQRPGAPRLLVCGSFGRGVGAEMLCVVDEPLGSVGTTAEDDVLDAFEQCGFDVAVNLQQLGIDDAHVHSRRDGVVEEDRVHRLAHDIVAAEGEREVRNAARHLGVGQVFLDPARSFDEVERIAVVRLDACGDGQYVGVENDLFGRESRFGQQPVGAFGHLDLAGVGVGLSPFVEEHHHGRCAVAADGGGTFQKGAFALFERDRVDDALALHDLQSGFEHLPFRRVDHHRHTGDFGLRGHEVQKVAHGLRPVDQAVVHADVDELRSGVDLCAGHGERFVVVAFADETGELRRAGHVGALADVDEVGLGDDAQRFETAQDRDMARCGETPRRVVARDLRKFEDMFGGGAATAADDVDQPAPHVLGAVGGEHRRRLVVAAHDVRKAGVGVRRDARLGHGGQPFQIGEQLLGTVGAVEPDRKRPCMGYRSVEGLDGLSRKGASRCVGERA